MPLTKLQFKPGVVKDTTAYSNEGGWVDSDKVRFRFGFPEKLGGWQNRTQDTFFGTPRSLHAWQSLGGVPFVGMGTTKKYYIESGGVFNNITPIRLSVMVPAKPTGNSSTVNLGTITVALGSNQVTLTGSSATSAVGSVTVSISQVQNG